ncbi:hypothetical protein QJ48_07950 [Paenibacillus sp. A3]|uniref:hypothetical protein n=1 Tax=Paenibacillus sp. A3 TaxID=1337054 RepID=UPI0006D53654|nr:hypothetical protein [Paenibacillus sp. A3]KPV59988.1 hypothetical protein QJ48_07950 [Paenibacillus sp. A3]
MDIVSLLSWLSRMATGETIPFQHLGYLIYGYALGWLESPYWMIVLLLVCVFLILPRKGRDDEQCKP